MAQTLDPNDAAAFTRVISFLQALLIASQDQPAPPVVSPAGRKMIVWGSKVSAEFRDRVWWIADTLQFDPDWLMTCIAWESGRSFSASVKNMAGSGATGLIQFMPDTAIRLGTTVAALAKMTAEDQLNYVFKYLRPWATKIHSLSDLYMTILWPAGVGQSDDYVIFDGRDGSAHPIAYRQNAGFDTNGDKEVTKAEAAAKLYAMKAEGANYAA